MSLTPDELVGWTSVAVAICAFGSFAVPAKCFAARKSDVHPLVYQTYKTFWCFASSWLVLLIPGVDFVFTPFGLLSACSWVPAGIGAIWSVNYAGLAIAQATWSSFIVLVSFAWGTFVFGEPVASWPLAAAGIVVMITSIAGMAIFSDPSRRLRRAADVVRARLLEQQQQQQQQQQQAQVGVSDETDGIVVDGVGSDASPVITVNGDVAGVTAPEVRTQSEKRRRLVGLGIATCSGIYGGSLPAGIKAAQRLAPNQPVGFEFVLSFGIGAAVVTAVAWLLHFLVLECCYGYKRPDLQLRVMAGPGAVAGLSWSLGNAASVLAVTHLGAGIGYSACQASLVVSGLWGIVVFREVDGIDALVWLLFAVLCAAALVSLAFQTQSGHSGGHNTTAAAGLLGETGWKDGLPQ